MLFRAPLSAGPFERLHREMDRLVESMMAGTSASRQLPAGIPLNVWESDGTLFIESELPGVKREDVELTFEHGELTIRAQRAADLPEKATTLRRERAWGVAQRVVNIPAEFDAEKIEANLHDGVLLITMPKLASAQPRRIEVKALPANGA